MSNETQMHAEPASPKDRPFRARRRSPDGPGHRQDRRVRRLAQTAEKGRDAVRAPEAHSGARQAQAAGAMRRQGRIPPRCHRPEPQEAGKTLPGRSQARNRVTGPKRTIPPNRVRQLSRTTFSTESAQSGPSPQKPGAMLYAVSPARFGAEVGGWKEDTSCLSPTFRPSARAALLGTRGGSSDRNALFCLSTSGRSVSVWRSPRATVISPSSTSRSTANCGDAIWSA